MAQNAQGPEGLTARTLATRRRLLSAAEREFGGEGYHDTSVAKIAALAGVGVGTFYLYFPNKESALRWVLSSVGDRVVKVLKASVEGAPTHAEAEQRRNEAYLKYMSENKHHYRIVQQAAFLEEHAFAEYQRKISASLPGNYVVDFHGITLHQHFVMVGSKD